MKKLKLFMVMAFTAVALVATQPGDRAGNRSERMETMKIGFLTQQLHLTVTKQKILAGV